MKQYIILFICLFASLSYSQEKTVHLAHGLGGDEQSWSEFEDFLQSQCPDISTTTFTMASNQGIDVYSNTMNVQFENDGANLNDVAIGHSFGGLALRNLDSQGTDYFGAYITVGSAHDGAELADNKINGSFEAWVNQGCKDVITDPVFALLQINDYFNPNQESISLIENLICGGIYSSLLEKASKFIGDGASVTELKTGDGIIANLPAASRPAIGIVCATSGNPLYSLLEDSDFADIDFNDIGGTGLNLTEATTSAAFTYYSLSRILNTLSHLSFFNKTLKTQFRNASQELVEGYSWITSTGPAWNQLIGAGGNVTWVYEQESVWICHCQNYDGMPIPCDSPGADDVELTEIGQICDLNSDCWEVEVSAYPVYGPDLPSDGLVPVANQNLPGSIHEEYIEGVSHFAQPGDSGVHGIILKQLKDSNLSNNIFQINNCL